jgi:nucleobase:cation symporter-1, NCS1 family
MTSVGERVAPSEEWGIEPVPPERRALSGFDLAILWGDLGVGLLVLVTGGLLVPALSFTVALAAIVVGSVIGSAALGVTAAIGTREGMPTMALFRPLLGVRGSWIPSLLNFAQLVGWTAVELWAMSLVADIVSREVLGWSVRYLWLGIFAVLCTTLALWGPVGVTRAYLKSFGAWVVVAICVALTFFLLIDEGIRATLRAPGTGGWPTFGLAVDLVIAMPISWLPLVADYSRFGLRARASGWGTGLGYLVANIWLYTLGAMIVLGAGGTAEPAGIALGVLAIAGGTVAGLLFLVGLLVGETDEAFADIYSGAVSLQNVWPRTSRVVLTVVIAAIATGLAATLTMQLYENFLFLIGSVFIPLFGVLVASHLSRETRSGGSQNGEARSGGSQNGSAGRARSGVRWVAVSSWVMGFLAYHWIAPTGPDWWLDLSVSLFGSPLSERWAWLGASVPSFLTAATLSWLLARLSSRRPNEQKGDDEDSGYVRHMR